MSETKTQPHSVMLKVVPPMPLLKDLPQSMECRCSTQVLEPDPECKESLEVAEEECCSFQEKVSLAADSAARDSSSDVLAASRSF